MTYERWDIVVVPFPFTDTAQARRRPALILSGPDSLGTVGYATMAMITSAGNPPWPLDVPLRDLDSAGLTAASVVRMKLFTLDLRFVRRKIGTIGAADRTAIASSVAVLLGTTPDGQTDDAQAPDR